MDSATGSTYLWDSGVHRHHCIIQNTHSIFPSPCSHAPLPSFHRSTQFVWLLMHSCQAFTDRSNLCGWSWRGIPSYPLTLVLCLCSLNRSWSRIPFGWHVRCGRMLKMGCLALLFNRFTALWSSEFGDSLGGRHQVSLEKHLEVVIEWVWRYTWKLWSSDYGYALRGCHRASLEMHLEAVIVQTWRPQLGEFGDTLGGCERASLEMHLEALIERVSRCTWRPWSSEIGGALGGSQSGGGSSGGRRDGRWDSSHWLTCNCGNVENWVKHGLPRDWLGAGDSCCWDDAGCGVCSTQCMEYSVYAVLGVWCTRCYFLIIAWRDGDGWRNLVFLGDGRYEDDRERDGRRWDKSSWENRTRENFGWKSSSHPRYGGHTSRSGVYSYRYEVSPTQSVKLYPWFLISACILPIILIFIPSLSFSSTIYHHPGTQSQVIPHFLCMPWSWVDTEYSIHWVQYPPMTIDLPFILMITSWPLNVASASGVPPYMIDRHRPALHESSQVE